MTSRPYSTMALHNYCRRCSPTRRPIGEPGCACENCGGPLEMSDLEIAETRAARNAHRAEVIPLPLNSLPGPGLATPCSTVDNVECSQSGVRVSH